MQRYISNSAHDERKPQAFHVNNNQNQRVPLANNPRQSVPLITPYVIHQDTYEAGKERHHSSSRRQMRLDLMRGIGEPFNWKPQRFWQ